MGENKNLVMIVVVVLLTVVSVVALVLGIVSLAQSMGGANAGGAQPVNIFTSGSSAQSTDKIWMIAIGTYGGNIEYLDEETYTLRGLNPDIVEAVCEVANKNCKIVYDVYSNCWISNAGERARGGVGLMAGWYDACSGWPQTFDRLLTFYFTKPFMQAGNVALYVKTGSTLTYGDLTNLKVGFVNGWQADEFCLSRYSDITGADDLRANQIIHYISPEVLTEAAINDEIDVIFASELSQYSNNGALRLLSPTDFPNMCIKGGISVMVRHNERDFVNWWNDAFDILVQRGRYDEICKSISERHGHVPGRNYTELCIGY